MVGIMTGGGSLTEEASIEETTGECIGEGGITIDLSLTLTFRVSGTKRLGTLNNRGKFGKTEKDGKGGPVPLHQGGGRHSPLREEGLDGRLQKATELLYRN